MQFIQLVISGIAQGCIYGLIALGFVLIYKATETVSFAQGELMMLGAFGGLAAMTLIGFPFWLSVICAIAAMASSAASQKGSPTSDMPAKAQKAPSIIRSPWAKLTVSVAL